MYNKETFFFHSVQYIIVSHLYDVCLLKKERGFLTLALFLFNLCTNPYRCMSLVTNKYLAQALKKRIIPIASSSSSFLRV
jgi:hypothetical protein